MVGRIIEDADKLIAEKVMVAYGQASLSLVGIRSKVEVMQRVLSIETRACLQICLKCLLDVAIPSMIG
jgi:hypothetical protein